MLTKFVLLTSAGCYFSTSLNESLICVRSQLKASRSVISPGSQWQGRILTILQKMIDAEAF